MSYREDPRRRGKPDMKSPTFDPRRLSRSRSPRMRHMQLTPPTRYPMVAVSPTHHHPSSAPSSRRGPYADDMYGKRAAFAPPRSTTFGTSTREFHQYADEFASRRLSSGHLYERPASTSMRLSRRDIPIIPPPVDLRDFRDYRNDARDRRRDDMDLSSIGMSHGGSDAYVSSNLPKDVMRRLDDLTSDNQLLRQVVSSLSARLWKLSLCFERHNLAWVDSVRIPSEWSIARAAALEANPFTSHWRDAAVHEAAENSRVPMPLSPANVLRVGCHFGEYDGETRVRTIQGALASAHNGYTILIHEGQYLESIAISQSVRLIGVGTEVILKADRRSAITVNADDCILENLQVRCEADNQDPNATLHCLALLGKNLLVDGCDMSTMRGHCIYCDPSGRLSKQKPAAQSAAAPTLSPSNETDGPELAPVEDAPATFPSSGTPEGETSSASANGFVVVADAEQEETKDETIAVDEDANDEPTQMRSPEDIVASWDMDGPGTLPTPECSVTIVKSRLHHASNCGLFLTGASMATVEDTAFDSCGMAGIEVRDHGCLAITGSKVINCAKSGVFVHASARAAITSSDIINCGMAGVELSKQSHGTLTSCRIYHGVKGGVFVHDHATLKIMNSAVFANYMSNIDVRARGRIHAECNFVAESRTSGVYVSAKGEAYLNGNVICRNAGNGIEMNTGTLICTRNRAHDNQRCAIFANGECDGSISENDLRWNRDRSINSHSKGKLPPAEENFTDDGGSRPPKELEEELNKGEACLTAFSQEAQAAVSCD